MATPRQKIHGTIDDVLKKLNIWDEQVIAQIKKNLDKGLELRQAVDDAYSEVLYGKKWIDTQAAASVTAIYHGFGVKPKSDIMMRKWYLNHEWKEFSGREKKLSGRIWKNIDENKKIIVAELRQQFKLAKSWTSAAKKIESLGVAKVNLPGYIWDLIKHARKNFRGDPAAARDMEKALRKAKRQVESLAQAGAPTQRLKKAYQNIINQVEKGSLKGIESGIGRAVKAKANYNSARLVRTEISNAYGEGFQRRLADDEDADGYRSILSSRHDIIDICDFHSNADLYGMGKGIYPINHGPPYPYHPHCTCVLMPFYGDKKGSPSNYNRKAGDKYFKDNPGNARKIMGKRDYSAYKNGAKWEKTTTNWNGNKNLKSEVPKRFIKQV